MREEAIGSSDMQLMQANRNSVDMPDFVISKASNSMSDNNEDSPRPRIAAPMIKI